MKVAKFEADVIPAGWRINDQGLCNFAGASIGLKIETPDLDLNATLTVEQARMLASHLLDAAFDVSGEALDASKEVAP